MRVVAVGADKTYLSIKEAAAKFGLSIWTVYELIRTDPSFPYKNVGLKKKLVISKEDFEAWIEARTRKEKGLAMGLPTAAELLALKERLLKTSGNS